MIFINEYVWVLAILSLFGLCGGFALLPFRQTVKYSFFAAPLAGLLMVLLCTSVIYNIILGISLFLAGMIAVYLCASLTIISVSFSFKTISKPDFALFLVILPILLFITYLTNYTTIYFGNPGFLYMHGSDHLGYAHLADWLNNHFAASSKPIGSPELPYQSWPEQIYANDHRFGSFITLALIAKLRNLSSMFAYDFACTVVLSASMLAIPAIFARSRLTFSLLLIGLLTCSWIVYSRSGYFGKLMAYPSVIFILGLFYTAPRPFNIKTISILAGLACAITSLHSFLSVLFIFGFFGLCFILVQTIYLIMNKDRNLIIVEDILLFLLISGLIIVTTGMVVVPNNYSLNFPHFQDHQLNWYHLLPALFDLKHPLISSFAKFNLFHFFCMFLILLFIGWYFLFIGIKKKDIISISSIVGINLLLAILIAKNNTELGYQLIGIFYPLFLCASIRLIDHLHLSFENINLFVSLLILSIALHFPYLLKSSQQYAGKNVQRSLQYSKTEFDELVKQIGFSNVIIDINDTNHALPILVELGRQNIALQWTPSAWQSILGYRPWNAPSRTKNTSLWLVLNDKSLKPDCLIKSKTTQYNLLECST